MMKKLKYVVCLLMVVMLVGCGKKYNAGEYVGSVIDSYGGENNTASAVVKINAEGKIESVYLDTTYTTAEGVKTTKKTLKDDYGMLNHPYGSTVGEWYQQVEKLEQAVIDNQGIDFLNLDEDGYTDAVSGCTIKIDALYQALNDALEKAKK